MSKKITFLSSAQIGCAEINNFVSKLKMIFACMDNPDNKAMKQFSPIVLICHKQECTY